MFFGKRKILRDGVQAQAVVLDCTLGHRTNSHGESTVKLELRVHYEDGTTADVTCSSWAVGAANTFGAGDIVPVRYDADDRAKVELDRDAIKADRDARRDAAKRGLAELADEQLSARRPGPPGA